MCTRHSAVAHESSYWSGVVSIDQSVHLKRNSDCMSGVLENRPLSVSLTLCHTHTHTLRARERAQKETESTDTPTHQKTLLFYYYVKCPASIFLIFVVVVVENLHTPSRPAELKLATTRFDSLTYPGCTVAVKPDTQV